MKCHQYQKLELKYERPKEKTHPTTEQHKKNERELTSNLSYVSLKK